MGRPGAADRRGPAGARRVRPAARGLRCGRGARPGRGLRPAARPNPARPGAGRPGHHGAARPAVAQAGPRRPGSHRGGRGLARRLSHADNRRSAGPAHRHVPARPSRLISAGRCDGHALSGGGAGSPAARRGGGLPCPAGLARPGSRLGRDRPAGAQRGRRTQRRPAGHRGQLARAHGAWRAGAHLPGTARRRGPPHLHDRRAGGVGAADHPGHARGRGAAAVRDRRHRTVRAHRDAAAAGRAARGRSRRRCGRPAAAARSAPAHRTARHDQGRVGRGRAPHRPWPGARPRSGRGTGRVPDRPGSPDQRAAARSGRRGGRGAALHRQCPGRADPRQRAAAGSAGSVGPAGGHGLAGMRERAAAVGGELRTTEAPGGGFLVAARLPAEAEELAG